jgi:5-enolpyruvylshikimate-3-phosphate synthase
MNSLWSIIAKPKNRQILSWIGGGVIAVAAGAFTVVSYLWPAHDSKGGTNCAENASIATQGDVSHVTINASGATMQANGTLDCGNAATVRR